jgi:hypothetical protein
VQWLASGNQQRHRLNTGGNRRLNAALHTVAVCQARDPGPGRRYYLRKLSEGKTPAEACRALNGALPTSSTGASWPTSTDPNQPPPDNRTFLRRFDAVGLWPQPGPLACEARACTGSPSDQICHADRWNVPGGLCV